MIFYALLSLFLFFFVLGIEHGFEEVEVNGKRYRAAPVFPVLLLVIFFVLLLGFILPGIVGYAVYVAEPKQTAIRLNQTPSGTSLAIEARGSGEVFGALDWLYWTYVCAAAVFPLGGYYLGYNLAMWLDARQTLPILIRYPIFRIMEEKPQEEVVVEELPKRKRREEKTYVILSGDLF